MTSSTKMPQRSLTQQLKWKELKGSLREGNVSSNDRKKMSSNKPDEPVKHIFPQFDNRPMPSDVVPDIEDVTLEVENLVLNKDIGVQTDEFSCFLAKS